jgi:Fe/S biogenesis protein NfuA
MISISEAAQKQLREIIASQEAGEHCLRLAINGRGPYGFEYELSLLRPEEKEPSDVVVEASGLTVFVDAASVENLQGATLDFVEEPGSHGFRVENPNPLWRDPVAVKVQRVIDTEINPGVATHGGHVVLLDVRESRAFIRLGGGCQGCGMVSVTLKEGIEKAIVNAVPEIKEVLDTTDHAAGQNPFYEPARGGENPFD